MFLRTVKARGGPGVVHEYVRLVEAYWEDGRAKQRTVANLGRKDLLASHVERLVQLLGGGPPVAPGEAGWVRQGQVVPTQAACWGPFLVARTLWQQLGLEAILDACAPPAGPGARGRPPLLEAAPLADRALVLVANRLSTPHSEHGLAAWLETDFVCDRQGQRFLPAWERHGRVQVDLSWLQRWYRTLDELLAHKAQIEQALFLRLRDLFALQPELVFYDLTSTYFEGAGPEGFARHGYSRDGKPHNHQVQVGMVLINGWPLAHHVFRGNLRDAQTVEQVIVDLEQRFGLQRVVFVGDRGMVTTDNLTVLKARGHGYVVGVQRRRREEVFRLIERATGPWTECPVGITAQEQADAPKTRVQEVASEEPGVRSFVVRSDERLAYERGPERRSRGGGAGDDPHAGGAGPAGPAGGEGEAEAAGEDRRRGGPGPGPPPRPSVLRLDLGRWPVQVLRPPGAPAPRAGLRGHLRHPDRGVGPDPGGGRGGVQAAGRRRAGLPPPQGRAGTAADLPSLSGTGGGPHLRGRPGLPAGSGAGEAPAGRGRAAVGRPGAGGAADGACGGRPGGCHQQAGRHARERAGAAGAG